MLSGKQQTRNYYKEHGPRNLPIDGHANWYAEISEVEEEHVSYFESLVDPTETPLERQVLHELMEVYNYRHCFEQQGDPRLKRVCDEFLHMEARQVCLGCDESGTRQGSF